jgi:choline dehydrogenase-like flavoprotein
MESNPDFLIVGSGAGGSAAAYRLAKAGRRVLLLEKGGELPTDGSTTDPAIVLGEGRFKNKERWLDGAGKAFVPEEFFNLGGKTQWYGAALLRYARDEFGPDDERGLLPWPLSYDDLRPYYAEAESLLRVRHFDIEPGLERILSGLPRGAGWHVESLPLGLASEIADRPEAAVRFDGFALPDGLKADAPSRLLSKVRALPNLQIELGAPVAELLGEDGMGQRVVGVRCADGRVFRAETVLLAAGALHSPRLLQRYMEATGLSRQLPAYDSVGRNYKRHVLTAVLGFSPRAQKDLIRKTALITNPRFPHSSIQPLGGWIDREIVLSVLPWFLPASLKQFLAQRVYGFFLQTEDGSDLRNRVIAETGGLSPRLDYALARLPHAEDEHRRLVRAFQASLLGAGLVAPSKRIPLEGSAHSVGTLVAGTDPRRSVVCEDGRVHGMENLYVVDGSVLPRSGRMNPALSIYAWSLRVAERLEMAMELNEGVAA